MAQPTSSTARTERARRRARASGAETRIEAYDSALTAEKPTEKLDRLVQTADAQFAGNLSPIALGLAFVDWAWHLAASPGRQMELGVLATQLAADTARMRNGRRRAARGRPALSRRRMVAMAVQPMARGIPQRPGVLA